MTCVQLMGCTIFLSTSSKYNFILSRQNESVVFNSEIRAGQRMTALLLFQVCHKYIPFVKYQPPLNHCTQNKHVGSARFDQDMGQVDVRLSFRQQFMAIS